MVSSAILNWQDLNAQWVPAPPALRREDSALLSNYRKQSQLPWALGLSLVHKIANTETLDLQP